MRLLILDCKNFKYQLDHKTPVGEEIEDDQKQGRYQNPLVIFITIESPDTLKTIPKVAKDIRRLARKNEAKEVILNPFAHLSANLAQPKDAIEILEELTKKLKECSDFKTTRSVFGWYKEFLVDVKGHENSQIFREY